MKSFLDPVVLFFVLGTIAGISKSDLRIPKSFYSTLSIYLLLAIGIKGGIELYHTNPGNFLLPATGTLLLGILITFIARAILQYIGKFDNNNAIAIASHYGSVSAVTFAVVLSFLKDSNIAYDNFMTVLLVMLEIPAIATGVLLYKMQNKTPEKNINKIINEVFFGKSILLMVGGLVIGWVIGYTDNKQINFFFIDLFKGFLAIFMLEMGIVASERFSDLKKVGLFLIGFGITMPIISSLLGITVGIITGLSEGGTIILATMAASASYIAAPTAMRIAIPDANPTFSLTTALGITFPFNILIGIHLYTWLTHWFFVVLHVNA